MKTKLISLFAAAAAASLVACGGGGGGGGGDSAPVVPALLTPVVVTPAPVEAPAPAAPPPAPTPAPSTTVAVDLVTSVTAPTYAAGTPEKGGWGLLMAQRSACGFGLLQQDAKLDAAAKAHSNYLVQNSLIRQVNLIGHGEDPAYPTYFTGANSYDRAVAQGYSGPGIEEILDNTWHYQTAPGQYFTANESLGATSMRLLIETVYHARGAFWAGRTGGIGAVVGFGPAAQAGVTASQYRIVSDISADTKTQKLGTGNVASFPCQGTTGINGTFAPATESPNPIPTITNTTVTVGTPLYFKADAGSVLVISAASMGNVATGSAMMLNSLTSANDPNAEITANEVFLIPQTALAKGATYTVHVVGTVDRVAFTRDFIFSTAM